MVLEWSWDSVVPGWDSVVPVCNIVTIFVLLCKTLLFFQYSKRKIHYITP